MRFICSVFRRWMKIIYCILWVFFHIIDWFSYFLNKSGWVEMVQQFAPPQPPHGRWCLSVVGSRNIWHSLSTLIQKSLALFRQQIASTLQISSPLSFYNTIPFQFVHLQSQLTESGGGACKLYSGGLQSCLIENFNTVVSSRTCYWALCSVHLWQMPN